jgi:hypothetical protein
MRFYVAWNYVAATQTYYYPGADPAPYTLELTTMLGNQSGTGSAISMTWRHLTNRLDKIAKSPLRNQMEQMREMVKTTSSGLTRLRSSARA